MGIVWLGSLSTPPASPELLSAYYNVIEEKSYIWDGANWTQMTEDGRDGSYASTIYRTAETRPAHPQQDGTYDGDTEVAPTSWFIVPTTSTGDQSTWVSVSRYFYDGSIWTNTSWSEPVRMSGIEGRTPTKGVDYYDGNNGSYVSYVFKNAESAPTKPAGGTFSGDPSTEGIPLAWSDDPSTPTLNQFTWVSVRRYTHIPSNNSWIGSPWSEASQLSGDTGAKPIKGIDYTDADGNYTSYVFSLLTIGQTPAIPTNGSYDGTDEVYPTLPSVWSDNPTSPAKGQMLWIAKNVYRQTDGVWSTPVWSVPAKFSGEDGYTPQLGVDFANGSDGIFTSYIFRNAVSTPTEASGGSYDGIDEIAPTNWTEDPISAPTGQATYISKGVYKNTGTSLAPVWSRVAIAGTLDNWARPSRFSGEQGAPGVTANYVVRSYTRAAFKPSNPDISPGIWTDFPEEGPAKLWEAFATFDADDIRVSPWAVILLEGSELTALRELKTEYLKRVELEKAVFKVTADYNEWRNAYERRTASGENLIDAVVFIDPDTGTIVNRAFAYSDTKYTEASLLIDGVDAKVSIEAARIARTEDSIAQANAALVVEAGRIDLRATYTEVTSEIAGAISALTPAYNWQFNTSVDDFVGADSWNASGYMVQVNTTVISSPLIDLNTASDSVFRMRIRTHVDGVWNGVISFTGGTIPVTEPTSDDWTIITIDATGTTGWTGVVTGITLDLGDVDIDYLEIGKKHSNDLVLDGLAARTVTLETDMNAIEGTITTLAVASDITDAGYQTDSQVKTTIDANATLIASTAQLLEYTNADTLTKANTASTWVDGASANIRAEVTTYNTDNNIPDAADFTAITEDIDAVKGTVSSQITSISGLDLQAKEAGEIALHLAYRDFRVSNDLEIEKLSIATAKETLAAVTTDLDAKATQLLELDATTGDLSSSITGLSTAYTNTVSALATQETELTASIAENLASANSYTRAAIGYCVDGDGNITTETDAVVCVAAGDSWVNGPLAEFVRDLTITTDDGVASVRNRMQTFETDTGNLRARAAWEIDVNDRVTGIYLDGTSTHTDIEFVGDSISFINPDTLAKSFFWDAAKSEFIFNGTLRLGEVDVDADNALNSNTTWSEVSGIGKPADDADVTGNNNSAGLGTPDLRNTNELPSFYWGKTRGTYTEFKKRTVIGAPGTETYGTLKTTVPWNDPTGGNITQQFYAGNTTRKRYSVDSTSWTAWSQGADDATANGTDAAIAAAGAALAKIAADTTYIDSVTYGTDLSVLQGQIDGNVTTWFLNGVPSLLVEPALSWTDDATKNIHLGDIYYDDTTEYAYRFKLVTGTYSWGRITDSDITTAIANAATAQDTADGKRRVFVVQPVPPYDIGDLWDTGIGFDRCTAPKLVTGTFAAGDWKSSATQNSTDAELATAANDADKTDGSIGGWSLDTDYIWSGTKQTSDAFTAGGITMWKDGAFRGQQFRIDTNGNAFFKGEMSIGDTSLTDDNTFNSNTTAGDIGYTGDLDATANQTDAAADAIAAAYAKTKADEVAAQLKSAGEQLTVNGTGSLGDNTNFSTFTYDGSQSPAGFAGSFYIQSGSVTKFNDDYLPVDATQVYAQKIFIKSGAELSRYYLGTTCYDIDKNSIGAQDHMYFSNTLTTLAVTLVNGATTATLTDASAWSKGAAQTYQRVFIFWDYTNSKGYTYPAESYSRHRSAQNLWANSGSWAGNVVTLAVPWAGGTVVAGTELSQNSSGGTYKYNTAGNVLTTTDWVAETGTIGTIDYSGSNRSTKFAPGTAFVRHLMLLNRSATASAETWIGGLSYQIQYETIAGAQAAADAAQANAISTAALAAQTKVTLAETTAKAYADGIVSDEEARAILDATTKANAAQAAAEVAAALDATTKAAAAQAAAVTAAATAAQTKAELAETTAKAYADGIVSDEEARAILDATTKADAAQVAAEAAAIAATTPISLIPTAGTNVTISGGTLTTAGSSWASGAKSVSKAQGGATTSWRHRSGAGAYYMAGLSTGLYGTPGHYNSINYAIYCAGSTYYLYVLGASKGSLGLAAAQVGDVCRVVYDGVKVSYYVNGVKSALESIAPNATESLGFAVSFHSNGGTKSLSEIMITDYANYKEIREVAGATSGTVSGWKISSTQFYSGDSTAIDADGYKTTNGIVMNSGGSLKSKNFQLNSNGDASFRGDLSGASGTFTEGIHSLLLSTPGFLMWYGLTSNTDAPTAGNAVWYVDAAGNYKKDVTRTKVTSNTWSTSITLDPGALHYVIGTGGVDLAASIDVDLRDYRGDHTGSITVQYQFYSGTTLLKTVSESFSYDGRTIAPRGEPAIQTTSLLFSSRAEADHVPVQYASEDYKVVITISDSSSFISNANIKSQSSKFTSFEVQ